tara:strand:+ start:1432 stop:2304 length:873 start_codon:yes stop_codon:yes gene_type:complete
MAKKKEQRAQARALEFVPAALDQILDIEAWLQADFEAAGEGFWCNWSVILRAFAANQVLCAVEGSATVGFAVWSESSDSESGFISARVFEIDIVVVKTAERGRGIGQAIVAALLNSFHRLGGIAVRGQCSPQESITFWRDKIGMHSYPPESGERDPNRLFMFLSPGTSPPVSADVPTIEFRAALRYYREETESFALYESPAVLYPPELDGRERLLALLRPILCAVNYDVFLRLSVGDRVVFDDKVKRLSIRGCDYTRPFLRIHAIHADQFEKELAAQLASLSDPSNGVSR